MVASVATIDAVVAVGIYLLTEILVSLYQCLAILSGVAIMYVIVCQTMNNHQVTL